MTTPHPRRRFFRYSLRTLFVVVTVACILMGTVAKRARDRKLAVEAILEMGGVVTYEHEDSNSPTEPPGPVWLRQIVGDEYFFIVDHVGLGSRKAKDLSLAPISRLTELRSLSLIGPEITADGLVHLRGLTNLWNLSFTATQVTDEGLVHLEGLTELGWLALMETETTDEGLGHLKDMTGMRYLFLNGTEITDAGLVHLDGMTKLLTLELGGTQITDAGLVRMGDFSELRNLTLDDTQITDAGLMHLSGLTYLSGLRIRDTRVTDEGVKKLQQALPNCKIEYTDKDGVGKTLLPATNSPTPQQ